MREVKILFVPTLNAKSVVLVSNRNVSLGINKPRGPHDHANNMTYVQTGNTTTDVSVLFNIPVSDKFVAKIAPIAN